MLSNTAVPIYYGQFRQAVMSGKIRVCETVSMEMNRIDQLIRDPQYYYDDEAINGFIAFCESELTLTDGEDLHLMDTFKLWAEQIFGWYYFVERQVPRPGPDGQWRYVKRRIKKRLINKQYLIIPRGAAKTMYAMCIQAYFLIVYNKTTQQITTAPTMKQAEEMLSPLRTAIARSRGPLFKFMTEGSIKNTRSSVNRAQLASTKKGIENFATNSILEIRPMSIDKLNGLRGPYNTVDEWLSGTVREDVVGALEQGASKNEDWLIVATSSEGTVRNGPGDDIKMELMSILRGEYLNPHVSIWYYRLDDIKEVNDPSMWIKANPNLGQTVSYETYELEKQRAEKSPANRNDILAKRFNIPLEGSTYFFTYEETIPHRKREFWRMPCAMGGDLSQGDDFCAFTFLFPLGRGSFGVKTRCYITELTFMRLTNTMRDEYQKFLNEGSLVIMAGAVLDIMEVYEELDNYIHKCEYDIRAFGYDPYYAREFVERYAQENGPYGIEKVHQGARTESVPIGELKKLAEERLLIFDQEMMKVTMGNAITIEDTNGNRKLSRKRYDQKIDSVAAMLDAYVAYKLNRDAFE